MSANDPKRTFGLVAVAVHQISFGDISGHIDGSKPCFTLS